MNDSLLHVMCFTLRSEADIQDVLRMARHACPKDEKHSILLFGDLGDADAQILPDDAPMLRRLQSGVMAMNARSQSEFLLLVRRRVWDDASRAFLGESQKASCRETVARLIRSGETDAAFAAATVSPASLKDRFTFILFSELSLSCTPDMPQRMADALDALKAGCICARVLEKNSFPQTALTRLCAGSPFSLSPLSCAQEDMLRRKGRSRTDAPAMYTAEALAASPDSPIPSAPIAPDCFFVHRNAPTLPGFFHAFRRLCLHGRFVHAILPQLQLSLFFLCAVTGFSWLAALALLPELWAFIHLRLLPGALLRLALLPLTSMVSLDALLCRALARSRLVRLRVPGLLITPQGCALFGAMLLPAAMVSAQALVPLLPIALLWFAAPLIIPALDAPTLERIPLSGDQNAQMRSFAESAFFDSAEAKSLPALRALAACAGSMLGLLEPDEAARQIEAQLDALPAAPLPAASCAAWLAAAQYLRERMGDCDAALRELPARIEAQTLLLPLERAPSKLFSLLAAARGELSSSQTLKRLAQSDVPEPIDLLFLPMQSTKQTPVYPVSLPLTHPHTFLKRQLLTPDTAARPADSALRFLFLAAAALSHPFYALLERSPVTGPYMTLGNVGLPPKPA